MVQSSYSDYTSTHISIVKITHTDVGWSNSIRQIFIFCTGAFRFSLLRSGGTPGQRVFVIASTLVSDAATKAVNNAINDSSYVNNSYIQLKTNLA
jgi:hypothetical protein